VQRFITWLQDIAESLGGPGLFIVALLDSSFLSLPQINDLLVVLMVVRRKARMPYYAAMATLGSIAGCYMVYALAKRGGEAFLSKRLEHGKLNRALALYRKYGLLALVVPALLPPPAPFKLFVVSAGLAGVRPAPFVIAIGLARGVRYFALGLLAVAYGDQALELMATHGRTVAIWAASLIVLGAIGWWLWARRRRTGLH
jgi:membrane protein YqaA with SNARE-associated domain